MKFVDPLRLSGALCTAPRRWRLWSNFDGRAGIVSLVKLSEKFARQESEHARLARIARRRISQDRAEAIRQLFGIDKEGEASPPPVAGLPHVCDLCGRRFSLPMHLGRHKKSKHLTSTAE